MDIFVGSLPFKITEAGLKEVFEAYGEVTSVTLIIDKVTRMKKGFGFVEMPNDEQAMNAIAQLNGKELMGRTIIVNKSEAKSRQSEKSKDEEKPKNSFNWKRHLFLKKPKENVITYGDGNTKESRDKDFKTRKKAVNFKVGRRKKK